MFTAPPLEPVSYMACVAYELSGIVLNVGATLTHDTSFRSRILIVAVYHRNPMIGRNLCEQFSKCLVVFILHPLSVTQEGKT